MRRNLVVFLALSLAFGCGDREGAFDAKPRIVDREPMAGELLLIDQMSSAAFALDVMTGSPRATVERIDVPKGPTVAVRRPGIEEVLVLCSGERDENDDWIERPQLAAIDAKHGVRRYELSVAFSAIELSEDGQFALLHHPNAGSESGDLLSNPNRVALVDLASAPSETNPVERTLKATGGQLAQASLLEPMQIAGASRPLALFTFADGLSVWDLSHPERAEIASEGLGVNGAVALRRKVLDPEEGKIYLIQEGLTDLRVLDLNQPAAAGKDNDFWPSWNQLPLGSSAASDLVLYAEADGPRVVVAVGSEVRIIDSNDSRVVPVTVPSMVSRLYQFVGTSPNDENTTMRLLGWSPGQRSVTFIELKDLESKGSRNMEVLELGNGLRNLIRLSETRVLTVFDQTGIGVLDLAARRFTPLSSTLALSEPLVQNDAGRVWVGAGGGSRQIGYFSPSTLETWSMNLDDPIEEMFLFETDTARNVVVAHASDWGRVTVVDGINPSRGSTTVVDGFLLDGLVK